MLHSKSNKDLEFYNTFINLLAHLNATNPKADSILQSQFAEVFINS